MLHDLAKGGLIQVGKNFIPRLKNAATGSTIVNRAEVKAQKPKVETPNQETETGGMESTRENPIKENETVATAVDTKVKDTNTESDRTNVGVAPATKEGGDDNEDNT